MRNPASGFDFLAPVYDILQRMFFGTSLISAQSHFLRSVPKADSVLVVGGGTGKILVDMLKNANGEKYHYIDISKKMIRATKRRVRRYRKKAPATNDQASITYLCAPVGRVALKKYDLIVTPFVLDCCTDDELAALIPNIAKSLAPNGLWVFTDFHIPSGLARYLARAMIRFLYFCFNTFCKLERTSLPDFEKHFQSAGLITSREKLYLGGTVVTRIYGKNAPEPGLEPGTQ